ncbi:hypothetical protein KR009_001591, partial [Drosophila setifemur]
PHSYSTTAASVTRRAGPTPRILDEIHRRLRGRRPPATTYSEKQIQTEDICDEEFLNAALLKISESGHSRSEGDESSRGCGRKSNTSGLGLRRTATSFELGRGPEQLSPLTNVVETVTGALDQLGTCSSSSASARSCSRSGTTSCSNSCSKSHSFKLNFSSRKHEMTIPEEEQEEQEEWKSHRQEQENEKDPEQELELEEKQEQEPPPNPVHLPPPPPSQRLLLSEDQRLELLKRARKRQSHLIAEYNRLPISKGSLLIQNLRRSLDRQLDGVDRDLRVLAQARVYM